MSVGWGSLPLLPLKCVLDHLSMEDVLAALSTCHHWRSAILLYEGRKEIMKLRVKNLEKNLIVARMYRKHTRRLHVYIDNCTEEHLDNFMDYVLPQFFESKMLQELVFIGPTYIRHDQDILVPKLNRIITESLLIKHMHCLQKVSMLGCEMGTVKNENFRYTHKNVEYYSRRLSFNSVPSPKDTVLSHCTAIHMKFSTLRQIVLDYDQMSTEALVTLTELRQVYNLTLNIGLRRPPTLPSIDWQRGKSSLQVSLNIVSAQQKLFDEIMEKVFVEGLPLYSLRVMFCKNLYMDVVQHVVQLYKAKIRELVWVDAPCDSEDDGDRVIKQQRVDEEFTEVNPLVFMCWQCRNLKRLVLHGYWVWHYDLIGFVRLRKTLRSLEVSAIYHKADRFNAICCSTVVRVLDKDTQSLYDDCDEKRAISETPWALVPWKSLHRALRPGATAADRVEYVLQETNRTT